MSKPKGHEKEAAAVAADEHAKIVAERDALKEALAAATSGDTDHKARAEEAERKAVYADKRAKDAERQAADAALFAEHGITGKRANAIRTLMRPDASDRTAELKRVQEEYGLAAEPEKPKLRRTPGPANPSIPSAPSDLISPEQYVNTPAAIRLSPEFRERVARSRKYWPKTVPASSFARED